MSLASSHVEVKPIPRPVDWGFKIVVHYSRISQGIRFVRTLTVVTGHHRLFRVMHIVTLGISGEGRRFMHLDNQTQFRSGWQRCIASASPKVFDAMRSRLQFRILKLHAVVTQKDAGN